MRQAQINVRTRACSRTSIARTKQAALTHNVRGKELTCVDTLCDFHQTSWLVVERGSSVVECLTIYLESPGRNLLCCCF